MTSTNNLNAFADPRGEGLHPKVRELFERIQMGPEMYQFRAFTRLKALQYLQTSGQIDDEFYWR